MPHVTFIHGLANKPAADILHQIWGRALAKGANNLDLGAEGVTTTMVYWADVLYPAPDPNVTEYENARENLPQALDASGDAKIPEGTTVQEQRFLRAMREHDTHLSDAELAEGVKNELPDQKATNLERIPLPWWIKKKIMEAKIRDSYLYLFNKEFSPRPGVSYRVQDELRRRFINALESAPTSGPHVVLSHSMGTMVAYDCLKRVRECPAIDAFVTMGSPLGIDEIQDCFQPEWTRSNGYPAHRIKSQWINLYDQLDVVCGGDPRLSNDYCDGNVGRIQDVSVTNDGLWRHSVVKYLARDETRTVLRKLLAL